MNTPSARRWYACRIPPPVLDAACALLMWLAMRWLPVAQGWPVGHPGIWWVCTPLIVLAGALGLGGLHAFARQRTTFNPLAPEASRALVTTGVYRFSRNPMYLAMLLLLAAWGLWLGNIASWLLLPLSVWLLNTLQIKPEERVLRARFGREFEDYARRVRRWL